MMDRRSCRLEVLVQSVLLRVRLMMTLTNVAVSRIVILSSPEDARHVRLV